MTNTLNQGRTSQHHEWMWICFCAQFRNKRLVCSLLYLQWFGRQLYRPRGLVGVCIGLLTVRFAVQSYGAELLYLINSVKRAEVGLVGDSCLATNWTSDMCLSVRHRPVQSWKWWLGSKFIFGVPPTQPAYPSCSGLLHFFDLTLKEDMHVNSRHNHFSGSMNTAETMFFTETSFP